MEKLRKVLSGEDGAGGEEVVERASEAVTLTWGRRVKLFLFFFILGACLSLVATFMLWMPGSGLPVFVVFYTVGNICVLISTLFLVGPVQQIRSMCAKERAFATILMLVCLTVTLCSALWWKNYTLSLIFCIIQIVALSWYGLSYIPFIREGILKCCSLCFC
ncbi:vesicle transport protein SFT2B-like [Scophthalmus maximus]|uniref:vesicle transport protein SFT2B-like n=1 Tax=Scophthalmus maximus TaxID=52904 RepID=UPI001FA89D39|nr:vesicle transport protein SFT2B-like [Scophthalmus maximus]